MHDLSWLLSHGYAMPSALKIVGDRHELNQRQRVAVMRCACSDEGRASRLSRELTPDQLTGATLLIDGYNVLTTIEAALGCAVILIARDTCFRDIASVHGTYRKVEETVPAIELSGQFLAKLNLTKCIWYLDSPVGNSGRLRQLMQEAAQQHCWPWEVELSNNPDHVLSCATDVVATADSVILDAGGQWFSLARHVVSQDILDAQIVDLQIL